MGPDGWAGSRGSGQTGDLVCGRTHHHPGRLGDAASPERGRHHSGDRCLGGGQRQHWHPLGVVFRSTFPAKALTICRSWTNSPCPAIPEPLLGSGIEQATDPPIKMLFISAANPVTNIPDSATIARALNQRFTVVVDMFMTDTAACADVILPTVTMLEDDDLIGAYGNHYLNSIQPVVPAPGEALTDYEILRGLAERLDMSAEFRRDVAAWKQEILGPLVAQGVTLERLQQEAVRSPFAAPVVFAGRKFPTPTGRANLLTEYHHPERTTDAKFPLRLMALSTDQAQASQWQAEDQEGPALLTVHPSVANGFAEGEVVCVESALGAIDVQLRFDAEQRTDLARMDKGGWLSAGRFATLFDPGRVVRSWPVRCLLRHAGADPACLMDGWETRRCLTIPTRILKCGTYNDTQSPRQQRITHDCTTTGPANWRNIGRISPT